MLDTGACCPYNPRPAPSFRPVPIFSSPSFGSACTIARCKSSPGAERLAHAVLLAAGVQGRSLGALLTRRLEPLPAAGEADGAADWRVPGATTSNGGGGGGDGGGGGGQSSTGTLSPSAVVAASGQRLPSAHRPGRGRRLSRNAALALAVLPEDLDLKNGQVRGGAATVGGGAAPWPH